MISEEFKIPYPNIEDRKDVGEKEQLEYQLGTDQKRLLGRAAMENVLGSLQGEQNEEEAGTTDFSSVDSRLQEVDAYEKKLLEMANRSSSAI